MNWKTYLVNVRIEIIVIVTYIGNNNKEGKWTLFLASYYSLVPLNHNSLFFGATKSQFLISIEIIKTLSTLKYLTFTGT